MKWRSRVWMLAALLLMLPVSPAAAQDGAPPGAAVLAMLPPSSAFGTGWLTSGPPVGMPPDEIFRDGAQLAYGGPAGARVALTVLQITDERVALRAAWEAATKRFDSYRHDLVADADFAASLATLPPPPGCAEVKRVEGLHERDFFVTGVTLCAVDPDFVLLAAASGAIGTETGYRAADLVVTLALDPDRAAATITASPAPP